MNRGKIPTPQEFLFGYLSELFDDLREARQQQSPEKSKDHVLPLKVTLKELYKGKKVTVKFEKNIICVACDGHGGKDSRQCKDCEGTGKVTTVRRIGLGFARKIRIDCGKCNGSGIVFAHKDKCRKCIGHGTVKEQKVLQVVISPGMHDDQEIVFKSEGDQERGTSEVGDVIVVLKVKPHEEFERRGDDLIMKRTITLTEALCGLSMKISHLDGRKVSFKNEVGKVIKQNSIHEITSEGMPIQGSKKRGNLYVVFEVYFPEQSFMTKNDYKKLESLLDRRPVESLPVTGKNVKTVSLVSFDPRQYERAGNSFGKTFNFDEDSGEDSDDDDLFSSMF